MPTPPARWFRIAYAQNAFLRSLGVPLASLSAAAAVAAIVEFRAAYRPQHAELDELGCSWGPHDGAFVFSLERQMHRHDHNGATLTLALAYALTPARAELHGSAVITGGRDATATPGYRAIARATVLDRTITLRGGEPLSS